MIIRVNKSTAKGAITAPPSKSMAHRYIICAALSEGVSVIENVDFSQDILATLDCIESLGAKVCKENNSVTVTGINTKNAPKSAQFMCRESGSTMRFFMGIAMCLGIEAEFFGSETLRNRPFGIYEEICSANNIIFDRRDDHIYINGSVKGGVFEIAGNISSQFISGLMFALPLLETESRINIVPPVESRSYINLTLQAMQDFGIVAEWDGDNCLNLHYKQLYKHRDISVEADFSNAAFLDAFNMIKGDVKVEGLRMDSLQGDRVYKDYYRRLIEEKSELDISDCPDLGPILFTVAAANKGGIFTGTKRLKIKESDRGTVMCEELSRFGVSCKMEENRIIIGKMDRDITDVRTEGHNDHRIVMSMAVLLSITGGTVAEAEAVRKSYPGFFEDIKKLGIEVNEVGMDK